MQSFFFHFSIQYFLSFIGQKVALVGMCDGFNHYYSNVTFSFSIGTSGSGKSTTIQLIERFYDANIGQLVQKTYLFFFLHIFFFS
jgi:ABC-type transport system involved in Fe-S cluster assembly fused permease/ATPase subunit